MTQPSVSHDQRGDGHGVSRPVRVGYPRQCCRVRSRRPRGLTLPRQRRSRTTGTSAGCGRPPSVQGEGRPLASLAPTARRSSKDIQTTLRGSERSPRPFGYNALHHDDERPTSGVHHEHGASRTKPDEDPPPGGEPGSAAHLRGLNSTVRSSPEPAPIGRSFCRTVPRSEISASHCKLITVTCCISVRKQCATAARRFSRDSIVARRSTRVSMCSARQRRSKRPDPISTG